MQKSTYRHTRIKFKKKDSERLYADLKKIKDLYFSVNHFSKYGNIFLLIRAVFLSSISLIAYLFILKSSSLFELLTSYIFLGFSILIIGISLGHDAAHNCLTGKKKLDNFIFESIFGLLGINGHLWKIKHNHSHHPFPNVHGYDTDMEFTTAFFLNPSQKKRKIHYYQHMYAPFLYMFASLIWIFYTDLGMIKKKRHANLILFQHSKFSWVKFFFIKVGSIAFFILIPFIFSSLSFYYILTSYIFMHFSLSVFMMLTFFISHHVCEVNYSTATNNEINNSWVGHQISATMDFHAESKIANFLFGGFNAHLAHHLFPDVCHIHYPALTHFIKKTLSENNITYNTLNYVEAVKSHLKLLKDFPRRQGIQT